jgi:hypothetical protein
MIRLAIRRPLLAATASCCAWNSEISASSGRYVHEFLINFNFQRPTVNKSISGRKAQIEFQVVHLLIAVKQIASVEAASSDTSVDGRTCHFQVPPLVALAT